MHWPLRRRPRVVDPADPAADPTLDVASSRESHHELHPERSRPRADWARIEQLCPASATPPLTFHGERFGRSVAGARPLLRPPAPRRSGSAPGGVVRDLARAGASVVPDLGEPAMPPAAPSAVGPILRRQPVAHRAPVAELIAADLVVELPPVPARRTHQDESAVVEPVSWTPDRGFIEHSAATERTRTVRPRASSQPQRHEPGAADPPYEESQAKQPAPVLVRSWFVPAAGPRRVAPPADLVAAVAEFTGIDVGDAVIDRSPTVTTRAGELGALAYTDGRTVHLPTELGPLEDRAVRAVTAHELVHVAQQRRRGGDLPDEASQTGQTLEAEARALERLVAGGAVVPAFLRAASSAQVRSSDVPPGVLRRAEQLSEYSGPDLSEVDLTDVEPGSDRDPFHWQHRPAEPAGAANEQRWEYGEQFETDNANRLQHERDTAYVELLRRALAESAPSGDEASLDAATPQLIRQVADRLDTEMPYQFGAPAGIDPYPPIELPARRPPTRRTRTAPTTAVAATGQAEEAAANRTLAGLQGTSLVHPVVDGGAGYGSGALAERFNQRLTRERELRLEVMRAKAGAARDQGAESDHVIEIDRDEIAEIRELIDDEYPLRNVETITYLPDTEFARLSLDGLTVDPPGGGSAHSGGGALGRRSGMARAGLPELSITRAIRPGAEATDSTAADAALERDMSNRTAREIGEALVAQREDNPPGTLEPASQLSYPELIERYEQRMRLELEMREQALGGKVELAVAAGAQVGDMVSLIDTDVTAIHEALDRELPVPAPAQYLPTTDHLQRRVTQGDVANRPAAHTVPGASAAVTDASPSTPTSSDTTVGESAAATLAAGPVAPDAAAPPGESSAPRAGVAAVASIVDSFLDGAPHASDEMAHQVVQSLGEVELEMLARRLYGRIRRELRTELLIDRERAGVLADIR